MSKALDKGFVEALTAGSELEKLEQLNASGKELNKVKHKVSSIHHLKNGGPAQT